MNIHLRLFLLTTSCLVLIGCASAPIELNRLALQDNKISKIEYLPLEQSLDIEESGAGMDGAAVAGAGLLGALVGAAIDAGVNSSRRSKFEPILESLGEFDANPVLENRLSEIQGSVFTDNLRVEAADNLKGDEVGTIKLRPTVIMNPTYSGITVSLTTSVAQPLEEDKTYSSIYVAMSGIDANVYAVGDESAEEKPEDAAKKYWIDQPEKLISKITSLIDEAVGYLVDDFVK